MIRNTIRNHRAISPFRVVHCVLLATCMSGSMALHAQIADFENLTFASGDFENGANLGTPVVSNPDPPLFGVYDVVVTRTSTFVTGPGAEATFATNHTSYESTAFPAFNFTAWNPWAYSSQTLVPADGAPDTGDPGYDPANNFFLPFQYSAAPGGGAGGSSNYGVGFIPQDNADSTQNRIRLTLGPDLRPDSVEIANVTFAALAILYGDGFTTLFGDGDFFRLTINGRDAFDNLTGTEVVTLADYGGPGVGDDFLLQDWLEVDLSAFTDLTRALEFYLESSDVGLFGMNTPAYFALDNLRTTPIPEPGTWVLLLAGVAITAVMAGRRSPGSAGCRIP